MINITIKITVKNHFKNVTMLPKKSNENIINSASNALLSNPVYGLYAHKCVYVCVRSSFQNALCPKVYKKTRKKSHKKTLRLTKK